MRCLVISDIHANLAAFEAVLADAGKFDVIWCLGDMVGYGPDPNECIERLRAFPHLCIAGNHDWAVLGRVDIEDFNPDAQRASLWTRQQLTPDNLAYLESLPITLVEEEKFTLVHGSPRQPIWEYILYPSIAKPNFAHFNTRFCFVGHTHAPAIFRYWRNEHDVPVCESIAVSYTNATLLGDDRLIINPGSVGQPRDGDARASYAILDTDTLTLEHHRVYYPVEITQARMDAAHLPGRLITRLSYGW
ncbi:MAG: metallophosphoesterase [Chloroflexi bacterium]|nr:metallophosphoesterase family protein [Anaerolineae bacterium]RLC74091.1 MAG: metallophosphoesterase [Chloroflexota bacterium]